MSASFSVEVAYVNCIKRIYDDDDDENVFLYVIRQSF